MRPGWPAGALTVAAVFAVLGVGAFAAHVSTASLQQDFAAYWVAGNARRLGLDPYVNHLGSAVAPRLWDGVAAFPHSRFLYPPLAAELFRPLAAMPYRTAKALFTASSVAAWLAAAALLARRRDRMAILLCASALTFPLYLHLERGQIDLFLLLALALAWRWRARPLAAGAALALAAAWKPTLLGLLPLLAALGRGRWVASALGGCVALVGVTAAVSGPALLREYGAVVLPRASLYGEGGAEALSVDEQTRARLGFDDDDGSVSLDGRRYRLSLWDGLTASASLPRLLAPESPSRISSSGPFLVAMVALVLAGRAFARRRRQAGDPSSDPSSAPSSAPSFDPSGEDAELLLLAAAAIACVVTSSAGWAMGLVLALPIAAAGWRLWVNGRLSSGAALALGGTWVACALPSPVAGWAALAGAALALAAGRAALGARDS